MNGVSKKLRTFLKLADPEAVEFVRGDRVEFEGYSRERIEYLGLEDDVIPAFLFLPLDDEPVGGVSFFHQHAGEFHHGKSEVAGDVGDEYKAFGPALARKGIAVFAPDAITFEDRRTNATGVEAVEGDWLQHYNGMAYRLFEGDTIMRKVLDDSQRGLSVLLEVANLERKVVGVAGHSYGGLIALYLAAVDRRCQFSVISGALASFSRRRLDGTGLNMFEVVPALQSVLETDDLLSSISPRPTMIVSATDDPYSIDADQVVLKTDGIGVTEFRAKGGHALDQERFDAIVEWINCQVRV